MKPLSTKELAIEIRNKILDVVSKNGGHLASNLGVVELTLALESIFDTKTDKKIREAFNKKIPNTTKIIIAQRVASVENCDKIIVMEQGKINAIGTHEELLKNNQIYREVYESQTKGGDSDE